MVNDGKNISPLFGCPGFSLECVCIGALHCMDLGISQDIIGCIFWEAIQKLEIGRTHKAKCNALWMKLKAYYATYKVKSQVQCLYLTMIKKTGETPKLKCKGAQTRHMVPFAKEIAQQLHAHLQTTHSKWVLQISQVLEDIYFCMDSYWDSDIVADLSMELGKLYQKLNNEAIKNNSNMWKMKPKLHMVQEMLEYQGKELGNPRGFWEYLDEDFVGMVAKLAMRKGGGNTHRACSGNAMQRCRALLAMRCI